MKAKYYIGILSLLLLASSTLSGQRGDSGGYGNGDARVVNNYYNDYGYSYASRIDRFHRSYVSFDYYNPFFSDPYGYDYQPYSLGLNLYGGLGSGFGFGLGFGNNWGYDPYYGINSYWGYDPFYYSNWYSPLYFNFGFGFGNCWHNNYYGWYGHGHSHDWDNYRPAYYSHNDRYGNNYSSGRYTTSVYPSRRNSGNNSGPAGRNNISRREDPSVNSSRNTLNNSNFTNRSINGTGNGETRRYSYASVNPRAVSAPQAHSSSSRSFNTGSGSRSFNSGSGSRSFSPGSGSRSISSHSSSRSSGSSVSRSGSSGGHSSGGHSSGGHSSGGHSSGGHSSGGHSSGGHSSGGHSSGRR